MTDPFVGKLTYVRVYSGRAESGSYVINASNGQRERLGRILEMNAAERIDRDDAAAGDIVACVGFKNSTTGDTLCEEGKEIVLEKIEFAKPVIDVAIEPKTKAEQDKMSLALTKLAEEDPTFQVSTNHETGQTIIAGMGELHLEIIVDRLLREFKVDANVGKPQVAYRETAGHDVEKAEGKFVRQSGGRGQYGHAVIKLEKMEEGFGYEFVNAIVGGVVPKEYIPSIDKGIQEALNTGVIAGFPVLDVKVTLFDGSYHEVDSSEAAFKIAGSMAIKDASRSPTRSCSSRSWLSSRDPRAVHGRRYGQPLRSSRQDRGHGGSQEQQAHPCQGAAGRDVRLRYRPSLPDPGPCILHDAVRLL